MLQILLLCLIFFFIFSKKYIATKTKQKTPSFNSKSADIPSHKIIIGLEIKDFFV